MLTKTGQTIFAAGLLAAAGAHAADPMHEYRALAMSGAGDRVAAMRSAYEAWAQATDRAMPGQEKRKKSKRAE